MDKSVSPIAVLGAGAWGNALATLLARNGQPVRLWDVNAELIAQKQSENTIENLAPVTELKAAVADVRDVCLVVPSFAFRSVLQDLKSMMPDDVRFVWGTKGLNPENAGFLHEVVFEVFSKQTPIAVLSGPSFAKEVVQAMPTVVSLAGNNADFLNDLSQRFNSDTFEVDVSTDMVGVQLCAVVKNVMAIATGISDGLGFGTNTRCALITRGMAEMADLCAALGGDRDTVMSLAGVGDLILTCTDNQSRNRRFGLAVGEGLDAEAALKKIGESVEGYYNVNQLFDLAKNNQVEMPIAEHVYRILYKSAKPGSLLKAMFSDH